MLKRLFSQNWLKLERQERARQNDPVAENDTQIRYRMEKILHFEITQ